MRKRTKLALLITVGGAAYGARQLRQPRPATIEPVRPQSWAKLDDLPEPSTTPVTSVTPEPEPTPDVEIRGFGATPAAETPAPSTQSWLPPVDGVCPTSHPLKGNDSSKIVHSPGGQSYNRTVPERCYATIDDAIADGYRPAKR